MKGARYPGPSLRRAPRAGAAPERYGRSGWLAGPPETRRKDRREPLATGPENPLRTRFPAVPEGHDSTKGDRRGRFRGPAKFRGAERRGGGAGGGVSPPHEKRLRIAQRYAIVPRRKRPVREKRGGSAVSIAGKRGALSPPPRSSPCRKPPPNSAARSAAGVGRGEGFPLPTKSDCASRSDAQSSRGESAPFVKNAAVPQALSPGNAGRFRRGDC